MLKDSRIWGEVPPGFKRIVDDRGTRLVVRHDQEPLISIATCRDISAQAEPRRFEGREKLRSLQLTGGQTALIPTYRHGGLLRLICGRLFFSWPPRPFRALAISEELRRPAIDTF